jgi:hypothetical protein
VEIDAVFRSLSLCDRSLLHEGLRKEARGFTDEEVGKIPNGIGVTTEGQKATFREEGTYQDLALGRSSEWPTIRVVAGLGSQSDHRTRSENYMRASGTSAAQRMVDGDGQTGVVRPSRENSVPSTVNELTVAEGWVFRRIVPLYR